MLNLLFPKICNGCKTALISSEKILCTQCRHALPLVCHHRNNDPSMKNIFYGRFPLEQATALIQFQKKGISQELMHNLKYRGQHNISSFFGEQSPKMIVHIITISQNTQPIRSKYYKQNVRISVGNLSIKAETCRSYPSEYI